jgi:hypothetical protein
MDGFGRGGVGGGGRRAAAGVTAAVCGRGRSASFGDARGGEKPARTTIGVL